MPCHVLGLYIKFNTHKMRMAHSLKLLKIKTETPERKLSETNFPMIFATYSEKHRIYLYKHGEMYVRQFSPIKEGEMRITHISLFDSV